MLWAIITAIPFPRQGSVAEFQPGTEVRPTLAEAGIDKKLSSPFCPQKFWGFATQSVSQSPFRGSLAIRRSRLGCRPRLLAVESGAGTRQPRTPTGGCAECPRPPVRGARLPDRDQRGARLAYSATQSRSVLAALAVSAPTWFGPCAYIYWLNPRGLIPRSPPRRNSLCRAWRWPCASAP